ncbi:hypothetical protein DXG01_002586 [Tephrocybe rancida]|nr:hypothetical protein DXG01_002586 [Tephrocybe rancida]
MCLFLRLLRSIIALLIISHASFLEALTIFPPPSPTYLGTTVRITWTSESQDPPFFNLYTQCQNLPITPRINASTVEGEVFIALPSGFNFGVSLSCYMEGKANFTGELLSQSSNFTFIFADSPTLTDSRSSRTTIQTTSSVTTPSTTPPPGPDSTVSLLSIIIKTEKNPITASLSTVSPPGPKESSSLSSFTFAQPAASQTAGSSTGPLPPHHVNIGAIVGASVGGVSLVVAFIVIGRLWMRRQRSTALILEPLAYSPEERSTPANRSSTSRTSGGDNVHENSHDNLLGRQAHTQLEEGTEERLRRMVEQMSERILALEAQQGEAGPGDRDQTLPPYSDVEAQNNLPHTIEEPTDASSHDHERQRGLAS